MKPVTKERLQQLKTRLIAKVREFNPDMPAGELEALGEKLVQAVIASQKVTILTEAEKEA